jgi:hypothetical protein
MSLKAHFQEASQNLSKILFHGAVKTDGRIIGPLVASLQRFVIAAEEKGISQDTSLPQVSHWDIDKMQELASSVKLFSNAQGQVDDDLRNAVQELVDVIYRRGITPTHNPLFETNPAPYSKDRLNRTLDNRSPK